MRIILQMAAARVGLGCRPIEKLRGVNGRLAVGQSRRGGFTSAAFTGRLEAAGVAISMDGRGRFMDNIFIERLWRQIRRNSSESLRPTGAKREPASAIG